ncbi:protocatechuate 3,4-dioxygenase subunit alpha [Marisediminicola antarctica]|uniref:Protocatechuate 3,4-dioxygenase subunit alpha n=1 Tax=Marisediminicola antarctica TaxID=674079 RepID=A0A7L5AFG0_9MICO|nr:protocatechuate 3,4-dioxygenase subunit alpha [Marisediminicola antarctica]QHO68917.1 protocatechuate 3,4-dioxygenase subunit alpha [Marisediminicola antarctica]
MSEELKFVQTPSQTIGPFFGFALPIERGEQLVPGHRAGAIRLHGTVTDGAGEPVIDAVVEAWQADETGAISTECGVLARDGYGFTGFGRTSTNLAGAYSFTTVKPGAVGRSAPYVLITIFARGLTRHLFTRAYFPEDVDAHAGDAVLSAAGGRAGTLVSVADGDGSYRFDIRLQGENETVYLDFDA